MSYAIVSEIRALDGLADVSVYPDATLALGIDFATKLIDRYCGTSFEAKAFSITLDGNGASYIPTPVLFIRSITSVSFDGVGQVAADFVGREEGIVVSKVGVFPFSPFGSNVVIAGTAGFTTTPDEDIKWAARTIARQYALSLHNRVDGRALQVSNDTGTFILAQPGAQGRPTELPAVNAVLNANKHKPGHQGGQVFT
jgi:hypothetical protein